VEVGRLRIYRTLADAIVGMHFAWIVFMCSGCLLSVFALKSKNFLERTFARTFHLSGIIFMGILAILDIPVPLPCLKTISEQNITLSSLIKRHSSFTISKKLFTLT